MKKTLDHFFLEAGINHFGQLDQANKILRYFLKSSFKNITYMIQSEKFYKKYKKRGLDFKLSDDFYFNAIKECKKQKKKFGLAVCDAASFKDKRDLNVDFYKLLSIGIDDYELIEMLKIKKNLYSSQRVLMSLKEKSKNLLDYFIIRTTFNCFIHQ